MSTNLGNTAIKTKEAKSLTKINKNDLYDSNNIFGALKKKQPNFDESMLIF